MNTFGIAKIDQPTLREEIYSVLRDAFTWCKSSSGMVLNLCGLAERCLGMPMTSVHEAVRLLMAKGALIDTPRGTLQVLSFDQVQMLDLERARVTMETMVLGIAMDNMHSATIYHLETITQLPNAVQASPDLTANHDFHFTLCRKSNSAVMLPLIEGLWLQYGAYLYLIILYENALHEDEHEFCKDIIRALRRNDRDTAKAAQKTNIESRFNYVVVQNLGKLTLLLEKKPR
jgi:DNA-binding GntR family transcriptional regulator